MPKETTLAQISSDGIPQIYFNGFAVGSTQVDSIIVLQINGRPLVSINSTFEQTKTLAHALNKLIEDIEAKSGRKILSAEDLGVEGTSIP